MNFSFEYMCIQKYLLLIQLTRLTVACHVIPGSERLVDVRNLELSESSWPGVCICCTNMELGRQMVKELDVKLTLGLTEMQ